MYEKHLYAIYTFIYKYKCCSAKSKPSRQYTVWADLSFIQPADNKGESASENWIAINKSERQKCSVRKAISQNSQGITCDRVSLFNKVAGLRPTTLLKKRLWHRCFPVNFAKFLRKPFSQNAPGRLLLLSTFVVMH